MPLSPSEKEQIIAKLIQETINRTDLPFYATDNPFVPGKGPLDAKIMLIGEAPGQEEARQQKPFVGRSGQLLSKLLLQAGFNRDKLFISNIVKYRPPNNKTPTYAESMAWAKAYLREEILTIAPQIIITLGACPTKVFLGDNIRMADHQGKAIKLKNITLIPTYHPAYLLRNPAAIPTVEKTLQELRTQLPTLVDNIDEYLLPTETLHASFTQGKRTSP